MKKILHRDEYIGIALFLFCAVAFNLSQSVRPGARTLPLALSVFMAAMSVLIILGGTKQRLAAQKKGEEIVYDTTLKECVRPLIVYGMVIIYGFLFQLIGYFAVTPFFLIALQRYLSAGSWKRILAVTAGYMVFTYILFVVVLSLPIYRVGILGELFRY